MDFSQSVAVITGAGSGIGQQLAIQLAQAGAKVAINDYNAESLEQTVQEIRSQGGTVFSHAFDVSDREAMHNFAEMVEEQFGQVDVMINNAGVALGRMKLEEISHEDFQWLININLWGVIHGTVAFLPLLRQRPRAKLVNVCSSFGLLAVPE
jgi:NADP-dependent 3-hydroxy acid dehydrogenase YdfG